MGGAKVMKEDETVKCARSGIDSAPTEAPPIIAESRWPMATAVAVAVALQFFKPEWLFLGFIVTALFNFT
jgi:hypothetical protein